MTLVTLNEVKGLSLFSCSFKRRLVLEDTKTQDAVLRNLEIMGEATKNLTEPLRDQYPTVAWREMARLRDHLIHHYFGVNLNII